MERSGIVVHIWKSCMQPLRISYIYQNVLPFLAPKLIHLFWKSWLIPILPIFCLLQLLTWFTCQRKKSSRSKVWKKSIVLHTNPRHVGRPYFNQSLLILYRSWVPYARLQNNPQSGKVCFRRLQNDYLI